MPLLFDSQMTPITNSGWRRHWFEIVYRHDTPPSRNFDLLLMSAILGSVLVVMLDSVLILQAHWKYFLYTLEWLFTLIFTADYLIRLVVVQQRLRYVLSIWGIIDLLSILPTYLSLFMPGTQSLLIVRVLRLLRLFRILKMTHYVEESGELIQALWRSRRKVMLFILHRHDYRHDCRCHHVCHRRPPTRLHQHSHRHVLGHRDHDHRRIR